MKKLNINEAKNNLKQELSQKLLYGAKKSKTQLYSSENINSLEFLTKYGKKEEDSIYVFRSNGKIILTPSYDNFKTVLAIFDGDEFDLNSFPDDIKNWFLSYAETIDAYNEEISNSSIIDSSDNIKYGATTHFADETVDQSYKEDWEDVEYIIPYYWGQGLGWSTTYTTYSTNNNPKNCFQYNASMFYEEVGENSSIKGTLVRVLTGCPVTSSAQILSYWGQYGINGKKYKVGSSKINARTQTSTVKVNGNSVTYKLKLPALDLIDTFNYNLSYSYYRFYKWSDKHVDASTDKYGLMWLNNSKYPWAGKTTTEQNANVATIMRYIQQGSGITQITPYASGGNVETTLVNGFKKYFNWGAGLNNIKDASGKLISNTYYSQNSWTLDKYYLESSWYRYGGFLTRGWKDKNKKTYYDTRTDIFETAIYKDLKQGIPVLFCAVSDTDGGGKDATHAFVCDGYKKDTDLWHFNFGWDHSGDGWYSLTSMKPDAHNYKFILKQWACSKFYPNEYYNDFIEASKNKIKFTKDASTTQIKIISHAYLNNEFIDTSNYSWGIEGFTRGSSYKPVSWLTLEQDSSNLYSVLNINIEPNNTTSERTYDIIVYKTRNSNYTDTIRIIQEPSDDVPVITYTLDASPTDFTFNYTGGETKYINVTVSPEDTAWTYKKLNTAGWLSTNKINNKQIKLISRAHTNTTVQTCDLKIYLTNNENIYKIVHVISQKYVNISVNTTTINFDAAGGSPQQIIVDATEDWEYTVDGQIDDLTITRDGNILICYMPSYKITIDRTCSINIHTSDYSASVIVTVNAAKYVKPEYSLTISPKTIEFTSSGANNKRVSVDVPEDITWSYNLVNPSQYIEGLNISKNNNQLTLSMSSYTNEVDRSCQYKIVSDEDSENYDILTINAKKYLNLNVDETDIIFESSGGTKSINIDTNDDNWTYNINPSNIDWLDITKTSRNLELEVEPNTTITTDRTCTITIQTSNTSNPITKQITVKAKKYVNIYAQETNIIFDSSGGEQDIPIITTDSNWSYEFINTQSQYLTVSKNNNTLHLEVEPYTVEQDNKYRLKLKTSDPDNLATFTVTITLKKYIKPESTLELDRNIIIFDYIGGERTITVTSNTGWNIQNFVCSWLNAVQTNNDTITLIASQNNTSALQTQTINVRTNDGTKQKSITVSIQPNGEIITGTVLKLSTYDVIFKPTITTAKVEIYSNTTYYIENNLTTWLTYKLTDTDNSNIKILELTSNYSRNNNINTSIIIHTNDDKETAVLNIYAKYEIQSDDQDDTEDNIGELDDNGNIIISRNGQNINISIYGRNGDQIIKNKTLLNLYIDQGTGTYIDITGNIVLENNNLIYHLNIPQNVNINKKLFNIYGTYLYDNQHEVSSNTLSFIQNGQTLKLYIIVNKNIFTYDDSSTLQIKYWAETSDNTRVYNTNDLNLIIDNNFTNPITYSVIQDQIIVGEQVKYKEISLNNNVDTVERKLNLKVVYDTYLIKNLIITQLSSQQQILNEFDFFTLEYNIYNDANNYISVNDYTNPNQLTNVNSYGGEGLQLIIVLSAESADGNIPINKTINNNLVDLGITWVGYNQEVNGNNTKYSTYLRYSGQNNDSIETESMLVNLYTIIQNLYEETTNINIDIYGHWTNTRSTGKINTKLKTYKNSPINIQLNNYVYSVDNNTVQTIETINNVYDLTNKTDDLSYYTHLFKLTYDIKNNTGLLFNIEQGGEYAKNIFVFSPGCEQTNYEERFITKYVDNEYYTEMYINNNSGTYKIYLNNSIYQTYNYDILSQYQLLLDTPAIQSYINLNKNSLSFTENGGVDSTVRISTNTEYEVILNYASGSATDWLTYRISSNIITFTSTQNNNFQQQSCTVIIRSIYDNTVQASLTVTVAPATVYLNIVNDITEINFNSYIGGTQTITVNTNDSWTPSIQNMPSQISYHKISNTLQITASENSLTTDVTCTLVITCVHDNTKTVSIPITLPGKVIAELSITKSDIILPYYGTDEYITVDSNIYWNLTSTATANSGIEITKEDSSHIKIAAAKNLTAQDKNVTITVETDDETITKTIKLKVERNDFLSETKENWNDLRLVEMHDGEIPVHLENMNFNHLYNVKEVDNIVKSYDFPRCYNWDPQSKNITVISQRQTANQTDDAFIAYLNTLNYNYMLTSNVIGLEAFDRDLSYYDTDRREEENVNNKRYLDLATKQTINGRTIARKTIAMNNSRKLKYFINNTNNHFVGLKLTDIYYLKGDETYAANYEGSTSNFGSDETDVPKKADGWITGTSQMTQVNDAYFTDLTTQQVDGYTKYIYKQFSAFDSWSKNWKYKLNDDPSTFDPELASKSRNIYKVYVGKYEKCIIFKNDFIIDGSDENDNICGGILCYNHVFGTEHSLNLYKLKFYKGDGDPTSYGYFAIRVAANGELDQLRVENCEFKGLPINNETKYEFPYTTGRIFSVVTQQPRYKKSNLEISTIYHNRIKDSNNIYHIDSNSNRINHIYVKDNIVMGGDSFMTAGDLYVTKSCRFIGNTFNGYAGATGDVLGFGTNNNIVGQGFNGYFCCPIYIIENNFYGLKHVKAKRGTSSSYFCPVLIETGQLYFSSNTIKNFLVTLGYFGTTSRTITYNDKSISYKIPVRFKDSGDELTYQYIENINSTTVLNSLKKGSYAFYDGYFNNVKTYFLNNKEINLINFGATSGNQGTLKVKGTHIPNIAAFKNIIDVENNTFYDAHGHVTIIYRYNTYKLDLNDIMFQESIGNCGIINHQTLGTVINPTTQEHFNKLDRWTSAKFDEFKENILSTFNTKYGTSYATFNALLTNIDSNSDLYNILNGTFNNSLIDYEVEKHEFDIANGNSMNSYKMFPFIFGYMYEKMPEGYRKVIFSNNEIDYQNCGKIHGGASGTGGDIQQLEFNNNKISVGHIIQYPYDNSTGNIIRNYTGNDTIASITLSNALFTYYPNSYEYENGVKKNNCYLICENNEFTTILQENCKISLFMLKYDSTNINISSTKDDNGYYKFLSSNYGLPGYMIFKNNKVNNITNSNGDFEYIDLVDNYPIQYPIDSSIQINRTNIKGWLVSAVKRNGNNGKEYNDVITKEEIGYDDYEPDYIIYSSNVLPKSFSKITKNIIYSAGTIDITIAESSGIISNLGTDGVGKFLQFDAPNSSGTYNIVLNIGNINLVKFKVIVL